MLLSSSSHVDNMNFPDSLHLSLLFTTISRSFQLHPVSGKSRLSMWLDDYILTNAHAHTHTYIYIYIYIYTDILLCVYVYIYIYIYIYRHTNMRIFVIKIHSRWEWGCKSKIAKWREILYTPLSFRIGASPVETKLVSIPGSHPYPGDDISQQRMQLVYFMLHQ